MSIVKEMSVQVQACLHLMPLSAVSNVHFCHFAKCILSCRLDRSGGRSPFHRVNIQTLKMATQFFLSRCPFSPARLRCEGWRVTEPRAGGKALDSVSCYGALARMSHGWVLVFSLMCPCGHCFMLNYKVKHITMT